MPADSTVRIGIIGAGRFAETHLDQFARIDGTRVVALCRRNEDALREMQRRFGIPSGYTDYRDMLNAGGIDAVSIVTPTSSHRRIALDAISAKLHVLCDKPLALNAADAKEMLEAAEKAGVVHSTNFNQRGSTPLGRIKRYVDAGYTGELIHIHIRWGQSMFDDVKPELLSWRGLANMGGGTVYELIHVFDAVRFLGGEVSRICALLRTSIPHRKFADAPEGMNVDAPDSSAFLLELHGGAYAVVHTSWVSRGTGPDGRTIVEFEVTGREGRIMSNGRYGIIGADMEIGQFSELDPGDPYPQPYELFINAIRSGEPVETSFVDGLKAAEIADAAIMSAREDRWIDL
jgi:predicted dehydrogenase